MLKVRNENTRIEIPFMSFNRNHLALELDYCSHCLLFVLGKLKEHITIDMKTPIKKRWAA